MHIGCKKNPVIFIWEASKVRLSIWVLIKYIFLILLTETLGKGFIVISTLLPFDADTYCNVKLDLKYKFWTSKLFIILLNDNKKCLYSHESSIIDQSIILLVVLSNWFLDFNGNDKLYVNETCVCHTKL